MIIFQLKENMVKQASNVLLQNILVVGLWELDQKLGALQVVAQKVRFLQFLAVPQVGLLWTSMHQHTMKAGKLLQNSFLLGSNSLANHGG